MAVSSPVTAHGKSWNSAFVVRGMVFGSYSDEDDSAFAERYDACSLFLVVLAGA